jgi:hypothetical protein
MSTMPVSAISIYQELQAYFQQRGSDLQQLGSDLLAGSIANAQQDFNTLLTLGQGGPSAKGDVFESKVREQDFNAIGQALKSGDLAGAKQAFAQLESTFHQRYHPMPPSPAPTSPPATAPINSPPGESIYQQLVAYYQQRRTDVQQLGQDLTAGNLADAQQAYKALEALGQGGPFKSGDAFNNSERAQAFNAIGQALNAGDLAGAQQAFAQLEATFHKHSRMPPESGRPNATGVGYNSASSSAVESFQLDSTA